MSTQRPVLLQGYSPASSPESLCKSSRWLPTIIPLQCAATSEQMCLKVKPVWLTSNKSGCRDGPSQNAAEGCFGTAVARQGAVMVFC